MNELQVINDERFQIFSKENLGSVRTVLVNNEAWFCIKDICDILELTNPTAVAQRLDEDERAKFSLGRQGETNFTNESGLYALIVRSDKKEAKPFRKWITSEVIPAIRKTGSYSKPMTIEDMIIIQANEMKSVKHRIEIVENKVDNEIRIDQSEQRKLQKAINIRVYQRLDVINAEKRLMFPAIHRDVKDRFGVASYRDIKRKDLTEALAYVQNWIEKAELRGLN
jgi:toxin-antitoxin system, toxin component, bro family|nr:MAG TPA: repressor domain protein [Caudoviricetes sp.]